MTSDQNRHIAPPLLRVTGLTGIATMVLLFVPALTLSGQEPTFDGSAVQILNYFRSINTGPAAFGRFVFSVGLVSLVWFVVSLCTLLRGIEGDPPWRSNIAAFSGVVLVAVVLATKPDAVPDRSAALDPQIARTAFDQSNVAFSNAWIALGSFAICCGWVIASHGFVPRWTGWWAIAAGTGLVLSRAVWTNQIWLLPYLFFWIWVLALSIVLLRRSMHVTAPAAGV